MSKTAIIELDSSIAELNFHLNLILPQYSWPDDYKERLGEAVDFIFHLTLDECLLWKPRAEITARQSALAEEIIAILGIVVKEDENDALIGAMEDGINEYVYNPMHRQLSQVVGEKSPYCWHVMGKGWNHRVITSGGIVIDLDRLKDFSGVVELDIDDHWRAVCKKEENAIIDAAVDEVSKSILQDIERDEFTAKRRKTKSS